MITISTRFFVKTVTPKQIMAKNVEIKKHSKYHEEVITHHEKDEIKDIVMKDNLNPKYGKGSRRRGSLAKFRQNYDSINWGKK